jgi:hypothetical protein
MLMRLILMLHTRHSYEPIERQPWRYRAGSKYQPSSPGKNKPEATDTWFPY